MRVGLIINGIAIFSVFSDFRFCSISIDFFDMSDHGSERSEMVDIDDQEGVSGVMGGSRVPALCRNSKDIKDWIASVENLT